MVSTCLLARGGSFAGGVEEVSWVVRSSISNYHHQGSFVLEANFFVFRFVGVLNSLR